VLKRPKGTHGLGERIGALEEERWTHLVEFSPWDPCFVDIHTLELDMCHLESSHVGLSIV
jgi:hypothetical protein